MMQLNERSAFGKLFALMCLCHNAVSFGTSHRVAMSSAGKVTVGLASQCVTDFGGLSTTYGLKAEVMEIRTPPALLVEYGTLSLR